MTTTQLPAPSLTRKRVRTPDSAGFYSTLRGGDVFLCMVPQSGAAWLGFLLAHYLKQDATEQLALDSFNKYVPDVNLHYTKGGSLAEFSDFLDPRFFLCHAAFDARLPKVVYVLRDPRDVMVANWRSQKSLDAKFTQTLSDFIRSDNFSACRWDQHVAGWLLLERHSNLVAVKYEDLHAGADIVLRRVLDFAAISPDPARIEASVEALRVARMRIEVRGWREELSEQDVAFIEKKYGAVMRAMGYTLSE